MSVGNAAEATRKKVSQPRCVAVLQQIAAIRGAVNGLMAEVLEGHLREHVGAEGLSTSDHDLDQIAAVLRSYLK